MFASLRLRAKLVLSFSVVLLLMAVTSGLAYKQFVIVGHEVEEYAHIVEGAANASHIETRFLKLRSHAREYAANGNEADATAVHDISKVLLKELDHAIDFETNPEHLKLLKVMQHDAEEYIKDFAKVEKLEHEYLDLVNKHLRPEGEKISAELLEIQEIVINSGNLEARGHVENAIQHALTARLYANMVIGAKDMSVADQISTELQQLRTSIVALLKNAVDEHEIELAKDVAFLAKDYEKTLKTVLKDTNEIRHLVDGEMAKFAAELIYDAEKLQEMAAQEEKQLEKETMANIETGEMELVLVGAISFIGGLIVAWALGGALSRPIQAMTNVMQELSKDNLNVDVPYTQNKDEVGEMASSVNHFKEQMLEVKRLEKQQQEQKLQADAQRRVAIMSMADTFEESVGHVVQTVTSAATELQSAANEMATTASQTSKQATAVAAASEEASANVQTVASASEELASSNQEIGRSVQQSANISNQASQKTLHTKDTVSAMVDEVARITNFAEFISDIADKTNMLALNATIESARAGEAGKGFAVVAGEVKNLANQTAKATEEIVSQIKQVNDVTLQTANEIGEIEKAIVEADRLSNTVASAVEEQLAATSEIARSVEQAAAGTQQVSENIQMVERASSDTGAAAEQIATASQDLSQQAEYLQEEVAKFLDNVRQGDDQKRLMEWDEELKCGIKIIDEHHKAFFEELNFYHGKMYSGISHEEVGASLKRIFHLFEEHIAEEENEMKIVSYPDQDPHHQKHQEGLESLKNILQLYEEGVDVSLDFFDTLATWLRDHSVNEDKDFAQYLKNNDMEEMLLAAE